ncbi:MAG: GIY-YIG nuclease family protein [Candidatus Margulisiibacteriota bacterium]
MIVYVIQDESGRIYTGMTNDVARRVKEHNSEWQKSTKTGKNWKLVFSQVCESRSEARQLEKYLKSGSFREKRSSLLFYRGVEQPGTCLPAGRARQGGVEDASIKYPRRGVEQPGSSSGS